MAEPNQVRIGMVGVLGVGAFVVLAAAIVSFANAVPGNLDDAFITLVYARHLIEGHGFSWNLLDGRVDGFTSLLDVLIKAVGLGVSFVTGSRRDDAQTLAYGAFSRRRPRRTLWALKDVSFTAMRGEVLGVIGPNGAGKTTLCRALAGLIKPDAGSIVARGQVSALLSLGTGFNEELSGRENILLNGLMLGLSRRTISASRGWKMVI